MCGKKPIAGEGGANMQERMSLVPVDSLLYVRDVGFSFYAQKHDVYYSESLCANGWLVKCLV
jgi:hypothetical protein